MSNLDAIRGRQTLAFMANTSGGSVSEGDVVVYDSGADESFTTTTIVNENAKQIGVVQELIDNGSTGRILIAGYAPKVNVNGSNVTRGQFLFTSQVAKAARVTATRGAGAFAQLIKSGTAPTAVLSQLPDPTASATITTKDEGTTLSSAVTTLDFVGAGVTASGAGTTTTVTVPSSGGPPAEYESFLSADRTIINATTWYSSASLAVTPAAGDYEITAVLHISSANASSTNLNGGIGSGGSLDGNGAWTGGTALAAAGLYNSAGAGGGTTVTVKARATLDGATAVRALGADARASSDGKILTSDQMGMLVNKASSIHAIKITSS